LRRSLRFARFVFALKGEQSMRIPQIAILAQVLAPIFTAPAGAQSPAAPPPPSTFAGKGHGGRLNSFLTPEQQAMFMMEARDQLKTIAPDQRKAWRQRQVQKLMAMSVSERQDFKNGLQAKFDALPDKRKQRLEQRIAAREGQNPAP
jgi:hypothetical protein